MRYIAMDEALPSQRLTAVRIAYSRSHDMLLALRVLAERSERDENKAVARGVCTMSEYSSRGPREYLNVTLNAILNTPMIPILA